MYLEELFPHIIAFFCRLQKKKIEKTRAVTSCDLIPPPALRQKLIFCAHTDVVRGRTFLGYAGWLLVVLRLNATLTAKVISWRLVTHMCFLAFSHQY